MDYQKIDMGSYNLHLINTKKFKTITVEVDFYRKLVPEDITIRNLLKTVLLSANNDYKTERELIKETENLYDLKILSSNNRIGNFTNLSFRIKFLNEKYTEKYMNEYSIEFLFDLLFKPLINNGEFDKEIVSKCKEKLSKSIKSLYDNKLKYTLFKLLETTKNKPYSFNSYGNLEALENITGKDLYDYYKSLFKEDIIDVFVVGDGDADKFKELFRNKFLAKTFKKRNKDVIAEELKPRKRLKKFFEKTEASQSQLTLLCSVNGLTERERKYTLLVYNELLGGSSNSLLFDTIREKNSYAYYVNSINKSYDNILIIYSGIANGNSNAVMKLIKNVLLDMNHGKFDNERLEMAKETIISSIKASLDNPLGIINTYFAHELVNSDYFKERIEEIKKVTKEDIIKVSKKIHTHTIYLLEGDNNEDN